MPWDCFACLKPESTDIKQLNYEHCTLSDVPAEVFAFERTLEELYLDSNRIRDLPRPLFYCHGLKVLSLSDNEVHSLPPAIASLINLHHLNVSRNALNSIPDNLKGCKHLLYVDVSVNPLEKLPEGFTQLISLEELYLNDTYLDFLPANFGRLMRLKILELRENNLNTLPKSIARLSHLQRLDIGQNDFSDVPEVIGSLPNLTELWIDSNRIRCIPPLIGNLKKLVHLEASNNNIRSVSSEIENCSKLLDLTLSCNELQVLPNTIGNLKELITLKLDDNQLSVLPNTIGKLSNLEELIVSQNDLESLPPCIGLLRKLHVLNVDDNMLEELPPEIGSCTNLTILSAHSNKLQHVPGELGHLSNLRVINLSENQLQNLPVSVLNLVQLTALWLSNNQSTPLTTLQQELDKQTGQMVCTNFMLPQSSQEIHTHDGLHMRQEVSNQPVKPKPHITFATDAEVEAPSRLMRAPTPYPKELRAMAKHARAMHHMKKLSKESDDDLPLLDEMVSQEPKDQLIKEAKVKKPGTDSVGTQPVVPVIYERSNDVFERSECKGYTENTMNFQSYNDAVFSVSSGEVSAVVAVDSGPIVREAKCVRKINSHLSSISVPSSDIRQRRSLVSNPEQSFHQPPPYHIAAAFSKKAMFFMQNDANCVTYLPVNYIDDKPKTTSCGEQDKDNHSENCGMEDHYNSLLQKAEEAVCGDILHSNIDDNMKQGSFRNSCDEGTLSLQEEQIMEENISNEVSFLPSSPSVGDTSRELPYDGQNELKNFHNSGNEEELSCLSVCELKDDGDIQKQEQKEDGIEQDGEMFINCISSGASDLSNSRSEDTGDQVLLMQVPRTFTQDKPVICEGVVAPTPQRPRSASLGNSNSLSSDTKTYLSSSLPVPTSPVRKMSGIPKAAVRGSGFMSVSHQLQMDEVNEHKQNQRMEQNLHYECETDLSHKPEKLKDEIWQSFNNSSTRIPVPCFYSPKNQSIKNKNNLSLSNHHNMVQNSQATNIVEKDQNYINSSQMASLTDCNLNIQSQPSSQTRIDLEDMEDGQYAEGSNFENDQHHGVTNSPILVHRLGMTSPKNLQSLQSIRSRIPAPITSPVSHSVSSIKLHENCSKQASKFWMFGPHRNATVFPVTIHKNSGLGFSISGGVKMATSSDRQENEIFVTKVHPTGPASGIIQPGDKILEVDGIDFTKLDHDRAVSILKQTGSIVNMMISRQQS